LRAATTTIAPHSAKGTTIRAHRGAAGETGGVQFQALGRSRGGFTTKVHLRCNAVGLPVGVVLTPGEAHDVTAYDALMEQRDSDPGAMLADKGYDSDAIRHDLQNRGAAPEITARCNTPSASASTGCVHASSASSVISRNSGVLPPGMTRPQPVF
jgi:hypothetical protein